MLEVEQFMQFDKLVLLLCRLWPMVLDEAANGWAERIQKDGENWYEIAIFQLVVALSMRILSAQYFLALYIHVLLCTSKVHT